MGARQPSLVETAVVTAIQPELWVDAGSTAVSFYANAFGANTVHMVGPGCKVDAWVDAQEVHLVGDIPILGRLLGSPLGAGLKLRRERPMTREMHGIRTPFRGLDVGRIPNIQRKY